MIKNSTKGLRHKTFGSLLVERDLTGKNNNPEQKQKGS
jgi:hypothetical protein